MTSTAPAADAALTRRQAELLDQLEELFLAEGFARFTLDDLALRLHCSKSTLYALAGSKEQLAHRVVKHFFRKATAAVEADTVTEGDPALRVTAYLNAVARALAPAGPAFHRDLDSFPPGREVYERNTEAAAERVRSLIADGRTPGSPAPSYRLRSSTCCAAVSRWTSGSSHAASRMTGALTG
jgi:AcrR family transcriptional regulator